VLTSVYETGASFFGGGAVGTYWTQGDFLSGSYSVPTLTIPGAGGVDIITFPESGIYLLIFQIYSYSGPGLNHVNILTYCTNVGVSILSSTANGTLSGGNYYLPSFGIVSVSAGATISFPDSTSLGILYGSSWATSQCQQLNVVRIS